MPPTQIASRSQTQSERSRYRPIGPMMAITIGRVIASQAVNITVQSYTDQMYFSITACAAALPDADKLRDDMLAALVELKDRLLETAPARLQARQRAGVSQKASAAQRASAPASRKKLGHEEAAGTSDSSRAA